MDLGWRSCFNWLKRNRRTWWRRFLVAQQFYQLERSIVYLPAADLRSSCCSYRLERCSLEAAPQVNNRLVPN
jgi:hypothetical protein